jgi:hypothetical protein
LTLPGSQFLFFVYKNSVLTSVFSQGITQGDTLRGSDRDARVMPGGICDTRPTLVSTIFLRSRFLCYSLLHKLLETKPKRTSVVEKMQTKQETLHQLRPVFLQTAPSDVHWIQSNKNKCCARIIAAMSVSFTKVQDFSKSQYT